MAKLIKKSSSEVHETPLDSEFTQIAESRRAPIIEKDTFEARAAAQNIRERAQAQADDIVARAQDEAKRLLEEAAAESERIRAEAHDEGYRVGKESGVGELTEVITRSSLRMQEIETQLVPQLSELAVKIARKVLGKELEFHPEAVVHIVKQALSEKARQRREISLRVHPDDLQVLREHRGELIEMLNRTKEIAIREDPEVERHGVIIETDAGTIDAQLETQLAVFERVLQEVR